MIESPPSNWVGGVEFHSKLPTDAAQYFGGGGTFVRTLSSFYRRVYFSHLAQRADNQGLLGTPDSAAIPVEGIHRLLLALRRARAGVHHLSLRRSASRRRRLGLRSAIAPRPAHLGRGQIRSVEGTDTTQEDFYTFSGRELHWHWKFLGWKDLLAVMDSRDDYAHLFGPNGDIPNDAWSVRRFAVVERTPTESHHPYSSVVMFWDAENWHPWMSIAFNREGKLWKLWELQTRWSEDFQGLRRNQSWRAGGNAERRKYCRRAKRTRHDTSPVIGSGYPNAVPANVDSLYDISKLEEMHR